MAKLLVDDRDQSFVLYEMLELEKLLGVRVDVATEKSLKDRIRRQIIKNAIPV